MKDLLGVVLAGGRSSRMGRDKALLEWQGLSLLDHMRALLSAAGADQVLVSGDRPGYDCIPDTQPGEGPGVALSHLLASQPAGGWALVVPVDMPMLTPELLRRLLQIGQGGCRAAHFSGHPLPALLPTRDPTGRVLSGVSIYDLHQAAGSWVLPVPAGDEVAFDNLNTPEEWQQAQTQKAQPA